MRTTEDCFAGSSAVDWLLEHVKKRGDFGSNVTRYYPGCYAGICSQMLFKVQHICAVRTGMVVLAESAPKFCEKLSQVRLVLRGELWLLLFPTFPQTWKLTFEDGAFVIGEYIWGEYGFLLLLFVFFFMGGASSRGCLQFQLWFWHTLVLARCHMTYIYI